MKEGSRANALLVELLLVIFFFMICSAILVQVFADARHKSIQAKAASESLAEGQNCAEALYALGEDENPEDWLLREYGQEGFRTIEDGKWALEREDYTLYITVAEPEKTECGELRTFYISAEGDGKDLYTLPSTRYLPSKEVVP